jgi:hypothetical protein
LQRLATTSTDCVEKLDPRQNATNQYYKPTELDFNARLEKQSLSSLSLDGLLLSPYQPFTFSQGDGRLTAIKRHSPGSIEGRKRSNCDHS